MLRKRTFFSRPWEQTDGIASENRSGTAFWKGDSALPRRRGRLIAASLMALIAGNNNAPPFQDVTQFALLRSVRRRAFISQVSRRRARPRNPVFASFFRGDQMSCGFRHYDSGRRWSSFVCWWRDGHRGFAICLLVYSRH